MPQDLDQQVKQRARSCMKPEAQQNNSSAASDITRGGEGGTSTPTLRMPQKAGLRRPTVLSEECCDWPLPSDSKLGGGGGTAIPTLLLPKKAGLRRPTNPSGARCDMPLTAESKRGGGAATPLTSINLLVPEKAGQRRPTMPPDVTQSNTSSLYVVQDMDDETETEIQLPEESKRKRPLLTKAWSLQSICHKLKSWTRKSTDTRRLIPPAHKVVVIQKQPEPECFALGACSCWPPWALPASFVVMEAAVLAQANRRSLAAQETIRLCQPPHRSPTVRNRRR